MAACVDLTEIFTWSRIAFLLQKKKKKRKEKKRDNLHFEDHGQTNNVTISKVIILLFISVLNLSVCLLHFRC